MVGKILEKRYVILEPVGADGAGFRYLAYDMTSMGRVQLRVDPDEEGQLSGSRFTLVDAKTPLASAPTPRGDAAASARAAAGSPARAQAAAPPVKGGAACSTEAPAVSLQGSAHPAPVAQASQPATQTAAPQSQASQPAAQTAAPASPVAAPGPLPNRTTIGIPSPHLQRESPSDTTQPIDLEAAEDVQIIPSVELKPRPRQRLRSKVLEAAWFAQGDLLDEHEEIPEEVAEQQVDQDDLELQARSITTDTYRRYALELSPPAPPPPGGPPPEASGATPAPGQLAAAQPASPHRAMQVPLAASMTAPAGFATAVAPTLLAFPAAKAAPPGPVLPAATAAPKLQDSPRASGGVEPALTVRPAVPASPAVPEPANQPAVTASPAVPEPANQRGAEQEPGATGAPQAAVTSPPIFPTSSAAAAADPMFASATMAPALLARSGHPQTLGAASPTLAPLPLAHAPQELSAAPPSPGVFAPEASAGSKITTARSGHDFSSFIGDVRSWFFRSRPGLLLAGFLAGVMVTSVGSWIFSAGSPTQPAGPGKAMEARGVSKPNDQAPAVELQQQVSPPSSPDEGRSPSTSPPAEAAEAAASEPAVQPAAPQPQVRKLSARERNRLRTYLTRAQRAARARKWKAAHSYAQKALALQPSNKRAAAIKAQAQAKLGH